MDFAGTAKLLRGGSGVVDGAAIAQSVADAAGEISLGLRQLVGYLFASLLAAVASVAHELFLPVEALWRWVQAAVAVVLPFALGVAAVLLLAALVWYCGPAMLAVAVVIGRALVCAACYFGHGLYFLAVAAAPVLACVLPSFGQCCAVVTMKGPGAAGMLISRAAFLANPALYFQILRSAGAVVAAAVFCTRFVALVVAAPVAALFRA